MGVSHESRALGLGEVVEKVREFIQMQLSEDVVEYKYPSHKITDLVGYNKLKQFMRQYLMPRIKASGAEAISGAIICGPIGGGKTFMFEAMASELEMVVLVLKNIRSQFFGQTDVLFERFRRIVEALPKALILVDEADTQFGGVGHDIHETERRLTGKVQSMMSDSKLRGRVVWLLITARINLLPADMKRQGRGGDLIIPVLDPEGEDREEFIRWAIKPGNVTELSDSEKERLLTVTKDYSTASYNALRQEVRILAKGTSLNVDEIVKIAEDILQPNIQATRRYQTLQALVNCTRRSLLPNPHVTDEERKRWHDEIRELELAGNM
ncbi:MAG: hypothetical protein G01um101470_462 [Parcubacteria group bacterium Gr01-1014_70]|nr:MAG: hypothetical protein G01um101470_462 [Parcubacteria group bacterium Gr01-1014_70]